MLVVLPPVHKLGARPYHQSRLIFSLSDSRNREMRFLSRILAAVVLIILSCMLQASTCHSGGMTVEVPLPDGDSLPGLTFSPGQTVANPWPAVLVAANAGGKKLIQYHTYCQKLSERGFAVLLLDASGYPEWLTPGPDTWRQMPYHLWAWVNHLSVVARLTAGPEWYLRNMDSGVNFLRNHPRINSKKIAISAFSQSANIALMYATGPEKIAGLIWNNGGSPWIQPYDPKRLPPTAIFHGEADGVYNVKYAKKLESELRDANADVECHIYPGERHMFNVYYDLEQTGQAISPAIRESFEKLVAFLSRTLMNKSEIITSPAR